MVVTTSKCVSLEASLAAYEASKCVSISLGIDMVVTGGIIVDAGGAAIAAIVSDAAKLMIMALEEYGRCSRAAKEKTDGQSSSRSSSMKKKKYQYEVHGEQVPVQRFKVIVRVIDDSVSASLVLFNDVVSKFVDKPCIKLRTRAYKTGDDGFPLELNVMGDERDFGVVCDEDIPAYMSPGPSYTSHGPLHTSPASTAQKSLPLTNRRKLCFRRALLKLKSPMRRYSRKFLTCTIPPPASTTMPPVTTMSVPNDYGDASYAAKDAAKNTHLDAVTTMSVPMTTIEDILYPGDEKVDYLEQRKLDGLTNGNLASHLQTLLLSKYSIL
uniref:Replication protein A 70 kDa DNA-binding subunit B n=1 Tax=Tanacetum cinerariifolium TaxID=118510 RepID=A0A6L2LA19_TANCI|nr:replication protein A 70 kDa DNA-binding subunit B [Tanacetum cinerariifolium]